MSPTMPPLLPPPGPPCRCVGWPEPPNSDGIARTVQTMPDCPQHCSRLSLERAAELRELVAKARAMADGNPEAHLIRWLKEGA